MKKITLLLILLTVSIGYSQSSPITFEADVVVGTNWNNETGIVTSIVDVSDAEITGATASPAAPAGMVGKMITASDKNPWQEAHLNMTTFAIDLTTATGGDKTVTVDVFSTTGNDFLLKVVNPVGGGDSFSQVAAAHNGTGWEQLVFDFKNASNSSVPDALYKTFVFFPLYDATTTSFTSSQNTTTAIDNIVFVEGSLATAPSCNDGIRNQDETGVDCGGSCTPCAAAPTPPATAAPTPPVREAANVISFYSDAYTDTTIDNFDYGECTGGVSNLAAEEVMIDGNATQRFLGKGCQGIGFETNKIDASAFTDFHFDFYTDEELDGVVFNIKLVDFAGQETNASSTGLELNFNKGTSPSLVPGKWISLDFDLTAINAPSVMGNLTRSDIAQIHITSNLSNAWYDNLYLYKETLNPGTCSDGEQNQDETGIDCGGVCEPCTGPPTVGAPKPPSRIAADVLSFYSDAYTDVTIDNFDYGQCTGGVSDLAAEEVTIDGNATQRFLGEGCQGIGFETNRIDASAFTHVHFDFFTDVELDGAVFNLKFVDFAGNATDAGSTGLEVIMNAGTSTRLVTGSWVSVDVDITSLGGMVLGNLERSDVAQIHITSNLSNAYYDNLYFHKNTVLSAEKFEIAGLEVYPNPSNNSWNIQTENQAISSIRVFDILGKQVVFLSPKSREARIDGSNLKAGIYFAQIATESGTDSIKLVKK